MASETREWSIPTPIRALLWWPAVSFVLVVIDPDAATGVIIGAGLVLAVLASSLVGLAVDSLLFLQLAFGSLDFLAGQVVGKAWMVLLSLPVMAWLRRRDERLGLEPA